MCLGIFPIESVAMNFIDINECSDGTSNCSADAMCNNTEGLQMQTRIYREWTDLQR